MSICANAHSAPIDREKALSHALLFMQQRGDHHKLCLVESQRAGTARMQQTDISTGKLSAPQSPASEPYYVFDRGQQEGFVIIAGNDASAEMVLGYCDYGTFDYCQLPPNMKEWLDDYARQMESLPATAGQATHRVPTHPAIDQLMTSKWGQGSPYNDACPMYFSLGRSVTGCVATAYAQILFYHREKMVTETQATMPSYTTWTTHSVYGNLHVDGIPKGSPIDWDAMLPTYGSGASARSKQAVADLMHYCGVGVKMDYTNSASAAQSHEVYNALRNYFGFGSSVRYINYNEVSSNDDWDALVYNELAQGRPVYISGSNSEGGHAFVCDGYDGQRRYHINWGWNGMSDGYYYLSDLTPGQQGTGGSNDGYNGYREIIIGIEPENYHEKAMTFADATAKRLCTEAWDTNGDGVFTYGEAAAVTSLGTVFKGSAVKVFTELHYFTALTTLDDEAFSGCQQLTTLQLPRQLTVIGARAFQNCQRLALLAIPDKIKQIGEEAFSGCGSLDAIELPQGLHAIEAGTFRDCHSLTALALPASLTRLGDDALSGCSSLTLVTVSTLVPQNLVLGSNVFSNTSLQQATLKVKQGTMQHFTQDSQWRQFGHIKEERELSRGQFCQLEQGQTVYLYHVGSGRYLTKGEAYGTQAVVAATSKPMRFNVRRTASMADGVYYFYSDDTDRNGHILFRTTTDGTVGKGVQATFVDGTSLNTSAYWYVADVGNNTYTLSIPQGYANYDVTCRWGVQTDHDSNVTQPTWGVYSDIPYEGHELDCQWLLVPYDADQANNYEAAQTLQMLLEMAAAHYLKTDAEQAVLDRLESTTDELVEAQRSLRKRLRLVDFADATVRKSCIGVFDYNADGELSLSEAAQATDLGTMFYGTDITSFDELQHFTALTELLGNSFENCTSLTSITLPESMERIYYRAFRGCSKLESINLPEYVNTIGNNAFDGCTSLLTVSVGCPDPSLITLGSGVFNRVNLKDATLMVPAGSKELYEQAAVWRDFGTIVEVRSRTQPAFSPIATATPGYIYNVGTRKYLTKGEAYGNQAVVGRKGMLFRWMQTSDMESGQYLLRNEQSASGSFLFRTSSDTKVGQGVKACFVDGTLSASTYWQIDSVAPCIYTLQVPVGDATHTDGEYLGTDGNHQSSVASPTDGIYWDIAYNGHERQCQWAFITEADMQAAKQFDELVDQLAILLQRAAERQLDTASEQAVYDDLHSTSQQLSDAVSSLRRKLHYIDFADNHAKVICTNVWDNDGDNELSMEETAAVTSLGEAFRGQNMMESLEELRFFTGLTDISDNAFRGASSLTTVYLPENVSQLGMYSFTECGSLKYVVMMNPQQVVNAGLGGIRTQAMLFVPEEMLTQYRNDDKWKNYTTTIFTGTPVVTALPSSRIYGRSMASMKWELSGAPVNGEPALSCDVLFDGTAPVGDYPIVVTPGTITTEGLICRNGVFTITPAPLTITARSYSRKQGEPNPTFEATYSGFRNRETAAVLERQPVLSCDATADSPAGTYEIIASGAEARNYDISYVPGVLTVVASDAVNSIAADKSSDAVYDLQGRRVEKAAKKGIYITRKRKIVK